MLTEKNIRDFSNLFKGLDRAYGTYTVIESDGPKVKIKAKTVIGPVTLDLYEKHLKGEQSLGIVPVMDGPHGFCWFGAIDIDKYPLDVAGLEERIRVMELPLIVFTTKSGGAHLYVFFTEPIAAKVLRPKLAQIATGLGFDGSEVFPKQDRLIRNKPVDPKTGKREDDDVGNWINLPYFGATRPCIYNGDEMDVANFLQREDDQE